MSIPKTLSQRGLQARLNMNVSTIRRRGEEVVGFATEGGPVAWRETWKKILYSNGRLMYYRRVKVER